MAGTKFELRSRGVDDSKTQIWRIPFVLAQERCEDGEEKESGNVLIASGREETRASGAVFQEALILIKSKCLGRNQARAQVEVRFDQRRIPEEFDQGLLPWPYQFVSFFSRNVQCGLLSVTPAPALSPAAQLSLRP
jgi:hypothetical protein